ncbi:hypothetical protein RSOL_425250, partial [Rhizoctonia solani AG-3 Rhs1AP]
MMPTLPMIAAVYRKILICHPTLPNIFKRPKGSVRVLAIAVSREPLGGAFMATREALYQERRFCLWDAN